ncbi:MAG: glycosyl hydrolase family 8, partial [Fibromonadales bacterium]|nr:glycosyl hydrolase family 8 [Fibromonadales bacterium]
MSKIFAIALICAMSATLAFGQTAKYPLQNMAYPNGYVPTTVTSTKLNSWYNDWKSGHLVTSCAKGTMATADDQSQVKVEGVGWALITTAYMGDKTNFDGIYKFYNASSQLSPKS